MQAVCDLDMERVTQLLAENPSLIHEYDYDRYGATALIHAVNSRDRAMVDLLLDQGADLDQRSDWWAGSFGILPCRDHELADYLISRGAMVDAHAAAGLDKFDTLKSLLDDDPSLVHARGGDGQFPLHFAASPRIVDLLLDQGANIEGRDIDHVSTAAEWAARERPEICQHLINRGAKSDPFMAVAIGDEQLIGRYITIYDDTVDWRINEENFPADPPAAGHIYLYTLGQGSTLLHIAAQQNRLAIAKRLLGAGADVNVKGGYDDGSPLHFAAWDNHPEMIRLLLEHGANIEQRSGNNHNNTPLGWAIAGGRIEACETLLENGATILDFHHVDAANGATGTAQNFSGAPHENWAVIVELLKRHGSGPG